jgi:hypothetical protein
VNCPICNAEEKNGYFSEELNESMVLCMNGHGFSVSLPHQIEMENPLTNEEMKELKSWEDMIQAEKDRMNPLQIGADLLDSYIKFWAGAYEKWFDLYKKWLG